MHDDSSDDFAGTKAFTVSGMTCGHCVHAVTAEISAIPGVRGVAIELATGLVTVDSVAPLAREDVLRAVDEAGYTLA
jgi:copper chaperone CopZ